MPTPLPPFDFDLLRTFVAIVDCGSFTKAAVHVGRTQSTVSLQIKRLEQGLGRQVFDRRGKSFSLTRDGEMVLGYARRMLQIADDVRSRLLEPEIAGTVRLGAAEDFYSVQLPELLARFARLHPRVLLEVRCDGSASLLEAFARGEFDLVLCKREPQAPRDGARIWRKPLAWTAAERFILDHGAPLPLVLAPRPDPYRRRALASLDALGRSWRIVYTSPSLAGAEAAVRAGLGVTVLERDRLTSGFVSLGPESGLPDLEDAEVALYRAGDLPKAADSLADHLARSLDGPPVEGWPLNAG